MFFYSNNLLPKIQSIWQNITEGDGGKIKKFKLFLQHFRKETQCHGHFKCVKKHKPIPKSCCLSGIMLLSLKTILLISMNFNDLKLSLNCFYKIFAKKRNSHCHFKCMKNHKVITRSCCLSAIILLSFILC